MSTGRRRLRRVALEEVGLQIAPMIDVTLLLLFFFMLSGKMAGSAKHQKLTVPTVRQETQSPDLQDAELIQLDGSGSLFLGERPITRSELAAHLRRRTEANPKVKLLFRADASTHANRILEIVRTASEAGVVQIAYGIRSP